MKKTAIFYILATAALFTACKPADTKDRDTLYQVNLLQTLLQGNYDGTATIKDLKENGDTGIGTFDAVNGELVALDGTVYQVLHDGSVATPPDTTGIPFATVSYFEPDLSTEFSDVKDMADLTGRLSEIVEKEGKNFFYMIKISGNFKTMFARSELKQEKPYKPLAKVLETDQREFHYENVSGTIIGLYCPDFMKDLNSVGFHLHFVSDDRTKGGHVFQFAADNLKVQLDKTVKFNMVLSDTNNIQNMDLSKDMSEDINKAERGQ